MTFIDHAIFALTLAALLGSGLIAGAFFAFSTFVMRALGKFAAPAGIAAMQSINIVVINPIFLGVFVGNAVVCGLIVVGAVLRWEMYRSTLLVVGSALYAIGTFAVTMRLNVPLNNKLAKLNPDDPASTDFWSHYLRRWTFWNHVRTVAALLACGAFAMSLRG